MKIKLILILILFNRIIFSQEAIVIKPVIDLLPAKMLSIYDNLDFYNKMPLSPFSQLDLKTCPRVHQILFNDIVKIIKTEDDEVLIETPNLFYQNTTNNKHNTFWTLRKNLILIDELEKNSVDLKKIPIKKNKILTLIFPFTNESTKQTYSAGTKFVFNETDNENEFSIYILNPISLSFDEINVPKKFVINKDLNELSKEKRILNFINIVKKWANLKHGFIPYVWGGCSFCNVSNSENFENIQEPYEKNNINYFKFSDYNYNPKSGFDCSGLIVNATKIAQIPFPFKNTTTISKNLKSLQKDETIQDGDLIWIPGHIIIIVDVKNNLCVEARGYLKNGAGKVHEIKLNKLFKNIENFDLLSENYFNKKKLERLDMQGNVFEVITNFKILKLNSVFK